jgi:hypothetical protein
MHVTAIQNKVKIMTAVNEALGNHNDSKGIMFSLPIDETVGLGTDIPGFCE